MCSVAKLSAIPLHIRAWGDVDDMCELVVDVCPCSNVSSRARKQKWNVIPLDSFLKAHQPLWVIVSSPRERTNETVEQVEEWKERNIWRRGKQNGSAKNEHEPALEKETLCFFDLCFFKCTCAAPYGGYRHTFLSAAFTKSLLHVCKQQSLWQDCATAHVCLIPCWSLFPPPCKYSSPPTSLLSPTCLFPTPIPPTYCRHSSHPTSLLSPVTSFPTPVANTVTSFLPSFPTCIFPSPFASTTVLLPPTFPHLPPSSTLVQVQKSLTATFLPSKHM